MLHALEAQLVVLSNSQAGGSMALLPFIETEQTGKEHGLYSSYNSVMMC